MVRGGRREVPPLGGADRGEQLQQLQLGRDGVGVVALMLGAYSRCFTLSTFYLTTLTIEVYRLLESKYLMTSNICDLKH